MLMSFVFVLFLMMSSMICLTSYPLSLGGLILLMSFLVVFMVSAYYSVFYGIILFLVFVGGLLVAFGYAVALASNPVFGLLKDEVKSWNFIASLFFFVFIGLCLWVFYKSDFEVMKRTSAMSGSFQSMSEMVLDSDWSSMLIILGVLLFLAMVAVVAMCFHYKGALVQFKRKNF